MYLPESIDVDLTAYKATVEIVFDDDEEEEYENECYSEYTVEDECECLTVHDRSSYLDCESRHKDKCEEADRPNSNPDWSIIKHVFSEGKMKGKISCQEGYQLVMINNY